MLKHAIERLFYFLMIFIYDYLIHFNNGHNYSQKCSESIFKSPRESRRNLRWYIFHEKKILKIYRLRTKTD